MRRLYPVLILIAFLMVSCLNLEEEPIIQINPTATLSAHIKDSKMHATALVNVNAQVLSVGNLPAIYEFNGELEIFDTNSGNAIDVNTFTGEGLSKSYTVTADTTGRERFVVIANGTIRAYADIGNDGDSSNDRLISEGDFYSEAQFFVSELLKP